MKKIEVGGLIPHSVNCGCVIKRASGTRDSRETGPHHMAVIRRCRGVHRERTVFLNLIEVLLFMTFHCFCYVYPDSSLGKESACSARRPRFDSWVRKLPWRRDRPPTPVFWPGESHGLCSPWGRKESDTTERLSLHSLLFTLCNSARDSVKHMYNLVHILFHLAYRGMLNIAPWGAQGDLLVSPPCR